MHRRTFITEAALAAVGCSLLPAACSRREEPPPSASRSDDLIASIEALVAKTMSEAVVPGVSVALIRDAQVAWARGFGLRDASSGAPVDATTVFEAASMSKAVFAYAVMKLHERRTLDLDTPLTKYTPERYLEGDSRLDSITARHVLSHTSGFPNWRTRAEPLKIHFTPGERFMYSGEGYSYLQSVVSGLTGRVDTSVCGRFENDVKFCATDIADYMKANLFTPMGMASSRYFWDDGFAAVAARPHDAKGQRLANSRPEGPAIARYAAAGGLLTTPTDYAKFLVEMLTPRDGDPFRLTPQSVKEMTRPHVKVPDAKFPCAWGLGWRLFETDHGHLVTHDGGQRGFRTFGGISPAKRSGIVVMTNGENGEAVLETLLASDVLADLL